MEPVFSWTVFWSFSANGYARQNMSLSSSNKLPPSGHQRNELTSKFSKKKKN